MDGPAEKAAFVQLTLIIGLSLKLKSANPHEYPQSKRPSTLVDGLFVGRSVGIRTREKTTISIAPQWLSFGVSIFKELNEVFFIFIYIRLGNMGVYFPHRLVIAPAPYLHGNLFWYVKMVSKRSKRMTESVYRYRRRTYRLAYPVYGSANSVWVATCHWAGAFLLLNNLPVLVEYRRALDKDPSVF